MDSVALSLGNLCQHQKLYVPSGTRRSRGRGEVGGNGIAFYIQPSRQHICIAEMNTSFPCPISMIILGVTPSTMDMFVIVNQVAYLCATRSKWEQ
jgi:hypothetical protein